MDKAALKNNEFNRTNNANTDMTPEFILPIEKTIQSPLYGRDNEINFLTRTYKQSGYRGVNIYGRRQVGKTSLLQYFCHVHPAIYYQVSSTSSCKSIFCGLRNAAVAFLRKDHPDLAKLLLELQDEEDIVTLIKGIIALSHKLNITLIIDEFPYLVEAVPDVCTELQAVIDAIKRNPRATDLDGVKRRTRAQMGRCQGGFCGPQIIEIIARETCVPFESVTKFGKGSLITFERTKGGKL
jgi:hypothetical protein